jgi:hypothetical protein
MKTRRSAVRISGAILISFITSIPATFAQRVEPTFLAATNTAAVAPKTKEVPQKQASQPVKLSFWAGEVVKLAEAGVDDDMILSFLDNVGTVNLGAAQIIYLTNEGVSRDVIAAMLHHDAEINAGLRPLPFTTPMSETLSLLPADDQSTATPAEQPNVDTPASVSQESRPLPNAPVQSNELDRRQPGPQKTVPNSSPLPRMALASRSAGTSADAEVRSPGDEMDFPVPATVYPQRIASEARPYAIRDPYAVKLLDPIVIVRVPGPIPNLTLVQVTP